MPLGVIGSKVITAVEVYSLALSLMIVSWCTRRRIILSSTRYLSATQRRVGDEPKAVVGAVIDDR